MQPTKIELTTDLGGLIRIFGDSLYADFGSVVRELVQNAYDSVVESCRLEPDKDPAKHRIDVLYNHTDRMLIVADDGTGMNVEELVERLNNFGRKKKIAEIRDFGREQTATELSQMLQIGQYGVGFLAAMAASHQVDVWTHKSDQSEVTHWQYVAGQNVATVLPKPQAELGGVLQRTGLTPRKSGTIVCCLLSNEVYDQYDVDEEMVLGSLRKYAILLPIPLFFNHTDQISCRDVAWERPEQALEDDWRNVIRGMFEQSPRPVIPLYSPPAELDLQGVLWLASTDAYCQDSCLHTFVRRMFVTKDKEILRPTWARFIWGAINSNRVDRIVSGNSIKQDAEASRVRRFIKDSVISAFQRIRELPATDFRRIVGPVNNSVKGAAATDAEFLECIWDKLRVPVTGSADLTLPECITKTTAAKSSPDRTKIYYFDQPAQENAANLVSQATGVPIVRLTNGPDEDFVREACEKRRLSLLSFADLAKDSFPIPKNPGKAIALIDACAASRIIAELREYDPAHVPAVLIQDPTNERIRSEVLELLKSLVESRPDLTGRLERMYGESDGINTDVQFYLNTKSELVKTLAEADLQTQVLVSRALYNISFMAAVPTVRPDEIRAIYTSISDVLLRLLKHQGIEPTGAEDANRVIRTSCPVRVFMATPYEPKFDVVEEAVRDVFEGAPNFFRVVLARDVMRAGQLLENLRTHIEEADAFVADITGAKPNVMLELGAVLLKRDHRPVFLLQGEDDGADVPEDLRSFLRIEYDRSQPAEAIAKHIRALLQGDGGQAHPDMARLLEGRQCRALTRSMVRRAAGRRIEDEEVEVICKEFQTLDEFISQDPESLTKRLKIDQDVASFVQGRLKKLLGSS